MNPTAVPAFIRETQRRIEVMQAAVRGERLQFREVDAKPGDDFYDWTDMDAPSDALWCWDLCDYRVAPAPAAPSGEARAFGETEDERKLWGLFDVVHVVLGGISQGQDLWSLLRMLAACMKSVDPDWVSPTLEPQPPVAQPTGELEKLRAFKSLVHARLDEIGVPEFLEHTCRVGSRLNWVHATLLKRGAQPTDSAREWESIDVGLPIEDLIENMEGWAKRLKKDLHPAALSLFRVVTFLKKLTLREVPAGDTAPEPPPAVRWRYFKDEGSYRWKIRADGTGGVCAYDEDPIEYSEPSYVTLEELIEDHNVVETTSTGEPLPQLPEGVPPLPEPIDQEYLAEMIHKVRSAAGNNQFTIELCGSLAVICKLAIAYVLTKAEAVPLETAPENP